MTRTRIRDLIRKRLGETTASFWTPTELNDWINDAGHQVAEDTKCIKKNGKLTTVTDTSEYTVSSTFSTYLAVEEVYMYQDGTTWVELEKTSRKRLNKEQRGWKSANTSVPYKYYWSKEEDALGLYPGPNSSNVGTDYVEIYYADDYTDMTDDADSPASIPHELQMAMVDYVVATGYETRGWGDKANDAMGKYGTKIQKYAVETLKEDDEDDDEVMKNYRNV